MALVGAVNGDPSQASGATVTATTSGSSGVGTTTGPKVGDTKTVDGRIKKFNGTTWNDMGPAQSTATQTASGVGNTAANQIASTIASGPSGVGTSAGSTTTDAADNALKGAATGASAAGQGTNTGTTATSVAPSPAPAPTPTPTTDTPATTETAKQPTTWDKVGDIAAQGKIGNVAHQAAVGDADTQAWLNAMDYGDLANSTSAMDSARSLAAAQQAGAVNSAMNAARSAGLSPAQAALAASLQGSSTYSDSLASNYQSANEQRINELLGLMTADVSQRGQNNDVSLANLQSALTQRGQNQDVDISNQTSGVTQRGQDLTRLLGNQTSNVTQRGQDLTKYLGDQGLLFQKDQANSGFWGAVLQAAPWLLRLFGVPAAAEGTEYSKAGVHLVGEHGPELVELPKGSKVTPIKDGHDMIAHAFKFTMEEPAKLYSKAQKAGASEKTLSGLKDMMPDLESHLAYIKGVKK